MNKKGFVVVVLGVLLACAALSARMPAQVREFEGARAVVSNPSWRPKTVKLSVWVGHMPAQPGQPTEYFCKGSRWVVLGPFSSDVTLQVLPPETSLPVEYSLTGDIEYESQSIYQN